MSSAPHRDSLDGPTASHFPTLVSLCQNTLRRHNRHLGEFGDVPFTLVANVLPACDADTLLRVQNLNPQFVDDIRLACLWKPHCFRHFPQRADSMAQSLFPPAGDNDVQAEIDWFEVFVKLREEKERKIEETELKLRAMNAAIDQNRSSRVVRRVDDLSNLPQGGSKRGRGSSSKLSLLGKGNPIVAILRAGKLRAPTSAPRPKLAPHFRKPQLSTQPTPPSIPPNRPATENNRPTPKPSPRSGPKMDMSGKQISPVENDTPGRKRTAAQAFFEEIEAASVPASNVSLSLPRRQSTPGESTSTHTHPRSKIRPTTLPARSYPTPQSPESVQHNTIEPIDTRQSFETPFAQLHRIHSTKPTAPIRQTLSPDASTSTQTSHVGPPIRKKRTASEAFFAEMDGVANLAESRFGISP
ncbi:hypothetical protein M427DRAFT_153583 [Gonapodya prolifera JEL478]|uniref:Elongin-A n=1 Tax=Gonapodya prolifera (strain JEL478) TaxID=1344416 RepID=A0A139ALM4_GONPJ|nr:hypothetical protein M427DRAFT_153583 [Gonapodya prolifera JEL478]|eukprot:KXS17681.1 hypothetical protein M427DRAFT_153583 [Gonapodya prolifera JEL478]